MSNTFTFESLVKASNDIGEAHRAYRNAIVGPEIHLESAKWRALQIAEVCKPMTGIPSPSLRLKEHGVRFDFKRKTVVITTESYCGEGQWERDEKKIRFPIRWLAMQDADIQRELSAWIASREASRAKKRAEEERIVAEKAALERRTADLAELQRLKSLYEEA